MKPKALPTSKARCTSFCHEFSEERKGNVQTSTLTAYRSWQAETSQEASRVPGSAWEQAGWWGRRCGRIVVMVIVILIVLGLCIGSFVNAFVGRLHAKKDWVKDRSKCDHCDHVLGAKDLVPVLSWLELKGKCRYCHKPISVQNPLSELVMAGLYVLSYQAWPFGFDSRGTVLFGFWLVFVAGFVALALYDFKWMLLPNKIIFPLIGLALIQWVVIMIGFDGDSELVKQVGLGLLVGGGLFYFLFQVSQGKWIGGGDVKLGALLGLVLGDFQRSILMLFTASLLGSLVAVPLLLSGKAKRGTRLPFGPFLLVAAIIAQLFGATIITWYKREVLLDTL